MNFDAIQKLIQQDIANRKADPAPVKKTRGRKTDDNVIEGTAMSVPTTPNGPYGTVMSVPGTEKVVLDTSTLRFMECESAAPLGKYRYCVVAKGVKAKYPNQFVDSNGDRAYIVPQELFRLMSNLVASAAKQVQNLVQERDRLIVERDLYKMTIDAFKKSGFLE